MWEDLFRVRLTELRQRKGVSSRDMSLSIGQNPGYINNIENGKALPSMAAFFYICEYLGVTPSEFFFTESDAPPRLGAALRALDGLDDRHLALITELAAALSARCGNKP